MDDNQSSLPFYFDLSPPPSHETRSDTDLPTSAPQGGRRQPSQKTHDVKTTARAQATAFVISLPDHLPNSPLCPANPKHEGMGTEICPAHGWFMVHSQGLEVVVTAPVDDDKGV